MKRTFFLFITFSLVVGCTDTSELAPRPTFEIESSVGTNGELISIQSDNVRAAGYDHASLVMTVQFDNGAVYEYYGVPADLWTAFLDAQPHPWSRVGYPRLVQGDIPYKRIS